jgi:hypothetical protein
MAIASGCAGPAATDATAQSSEAGDKVCGVGVTPVFVPASDDTPERFRAFLGQWGDGSDRWDGALCHALYVEEVRPDGSAFALYVHGVAAQYGIAKPNAVRMKGKIEGNALTFLRPRASIEIRYVLNDDRSALSGTWENPDTWSRITLPRISPTN